MEREYIPSSIISNILEYGGKQYLLGIKDEELVERIRLYQPSFNYDTWLSDVEFKKRFIERMKANPLIILYNYVKQYKLTLMIMDKSIQIITGQISDARGVYDIFMQLGYNPERFRQLPSSMILIDFIHTEKIRYDLSELWLYMEPRSGSISYNYSRDNTIQYGLGDLVYIADRLSTPLSLPDYLRYIIRRNRDEVKIKKYKEYSLYLMLQPYGWSYSVPKNGISLSILITRGIDISTDIQDELIKIYGEVYIAYNESGSFALKGTYTLKLIEIDMFYHPYIVQYIELFK